MAGMLYITCPKTNRDVPTGVITEEMTARTSNSKARMRCPSCGDDHEWNPREARLGPVEKNPRNDGEQRPPKR